MGDHQASPLCSTCSVHEKQSSKVNFMWGAGWSFIIIIATMVTIILIGQGVNRTGIAENRASIVAHEKKINDSLHAVEKTLNIMSVNQIRHMREDGVDYIEPEPIRHE